MIRKNVGRLSANGAFDTPEVLHLDGIVDGVSGDNNNEQMNPANFRVSTKKQFFSEDETHQSCTEVSSEGGKNAGLLRTFHPSGTLA